MFFLIWSEILSSRSEFVGTKSLSSKLTILLELTVTVTEPLTKQIATNLIYFNNIINISIAKQKKNQQELSSEDCRVANIG